MLAKKKWGRALARLVTVLFVLILGSTTFGSVGGASTKLDTSNPFLIASPNAATGALKGVVGVQWKASLEAATHYINAHGGILGREVVVNYVDTQSSPTVAATVLSNMLESKHYDAVIPTSTDALSELEVAKAHHIIDIWPANPSNAADPKVYPTHFDPDYLLTQDGTQLACMVQQELPKNQPKTVGYLYTELPSDQEAFASVSAHAAADGYKLVATEGFEPGTLDITPELAKIEAAHPSLLILGALSGDENTVFRGLTALNYHPKIMGDWFAASNSPSQYVTPVSEVPAVFPVFSQALDDRVNGTLTPEQLSVISKVQHYLPGGQFTGALFGYTFDWDSLFLVKFAADKSHSDSTPAMVTALQSLAAHPVKDIGTIFDPSPRFSSTNHGYTGPTDYIANVNGSYKDGTWPTISNTPIPSSCPAHGAS